MAEPLNKEHLVEHSSALNAELGNHSRRMQGTCLSQWHSP